MEVNAQRYWFGFSSQQDLRLATIESYSQNSSLHCGCHSTNAHTCNRNNWKILIKIITTDNYVIMFN